MTKDYNDKPEAINVPETNFKIQIDKKHYEVFGPFISGRELLEKAGKTPTEDYAIYLKVKGDQPKRIDLDEKVDLSKPGVEKFVTLPLDQTDGLDERRDFVLPQEDTEWLDRAPYRYELVAENNVLRVVLYDFPLPTGYQQTHADVNVRIESGYPDSQIDMVYVYPALARTDSKPIAAISSDNFDGKQWQRWSRHRTQANPWRPGTDNLATHFGLVEYWFTRELSKS